MTRVVYYTATTLDGFLADEHDSLDWLFKQDIDEAGPMSYGGFIAGVGAIAMGATTYEWITDHIGDSDDALHERWAYDMPAWVFTHRDLEPVDDADIRIVSGPVADHWDAIAAAAGVKDVWVVGGGDLAAQFAEAGHLDEVMASIAPVTLGAGRPIFPRRFDFELIELARNRAFVCARFAVVGPLST